ncbi:P-loop containing nucleoside triphosphate hydrolase protein [Crassisporium funariophilum]|nr:P-loop containing nucleoside triphosphate hydrolase protein [Crassisporium funariophilum]
MAKNRKRANQAKGKNRIPVKPEDVVVEGGSLKDIVIPVMGPTGAGKSTFINSLLGKERMRVGHYLTSCTAHLEFDIIPCDSRRFPDLAGYRVIIVDTPGFDDTYEGDAEILRRIADWLKNSYRQEMVLGGVIYLHDISQDRFSGTARRNLEMFNHLCGDAALSKVVLGTTKWGRVPREAAVNRERELRCTHWKFMIDKGSNMLPFTGDRQTAQAFVDLVVGLFANAMFASSSSGQDSFESAVPLEIQKELALERKIIPQTLAGQELRYTLQEVLEMQKQMVGYETALAKGGDQEAKKKLEETREKMEKIQKGIQDLKIPFMKRLLGFFGP